MATPAPLHGSRVPSPISSSSGEGLTDAQKLQLVVRNCVQKAVELVLHSRVIPLPPHMRRGSTNRWVRRTALLPSSPCTRHTLQLPLLVLTLVGGSHQLGGLALHRAPILHPPTHSAAQRTLTGVRRVQFNLESEELLTVRDELEEWRQDMAQPLQLDILLQTVRHRARTEEEQAGPRTGCHPHA